VISQDLRQLIPRFQRVTWIIWFAFFFAPVLYAVLEWVVSAGGTRQMNAELPAQAVYVLYLLAVLSGLVLPWVLAPVIAGPKKLVQSNSSTRLITDFGEEQARYERLSGSEKNKAQHFGAIQASMIVRWAGAESVAIYGFLGLMTGLLPLYGAWAFAIASMLLLVALKPDYEAELERLDV
jgi:hypothetical protein